MAGQLEGWKAGRLGSWRAGRLELEDWKAGRLEGGRLEGWRAGGLEGWRAGGLEGGLEGWRAWSEGGCSGHLNFRFKQVIYTTSVILGPGPPSTYLKSVTVHSRHDGVAPNFKILSRVI